jgi:NADPH2:quinone reductase
MNGGFMRAIRVHQHGGPEVLSAQDVPLPEPKSGEARVKLEAIGVNFIDIYQRTGLYKIPVPFTLGMEGAGIVDTVADGVTEVKPGDRVAYAMVVGSYAEYAAVPAAKLAPMPADLDFASAAALIRTLSVPQYLPAEER